MSTKHPYLSLNADPTVAIVKGVDRDVEKGEDILMLGYALVLMAPLFVRVTPPTVLLPLMALSFLISVCWARWQLHTIHQHFSSAMNQVANTASILRPIELFFNEHPEHTLTIAFNPLKNIARTLKSFFGGLLINPFWMPIFYLLGMQFLEEKQLQLLNKAVIEIEQRLPHYHRD